MALVCSRPAEQLEGQDGERKDIDLVRVGLGGPHLGCHVAHRACLTRHVRREGSFGWGRRSPPQWAGLARWRRRERQLRMAPAQLIVHDQSCEPKVDHLWEVGGAS